MPAAISNGLPGEGGASAGATTLGHGAKRRRRKPARHPAKPRKHAAKHHKHAAKHHKPHKKHKKRRPKRHTPAKRPPISASPPPTSIPQPAPPPSPGPAPAQSAYVYSGPFGYRQAERLLWRAGFGPSPGLAQALASLGLQRAVYALTRPSGAATLSGPAPNDGSGNALDPANAYGHDHLYWLDRMVRGSQPLVERMALIWHDWFATSNQGVGNQQFMLDQTDLFRAHALGSFQDLALGVTQDRAMLLWLNGIENRAGSPNENYARELMELFTLGAERNAYTETDVRELARTLTGFTADYVGGTGWTNFRFEPSRHDTGTKKVFGFSGKYNWDDGIRMCIAHGLHPSFFVVKLWSYFVPSPPDAGTQAMLEAVYRGSGHEIRPVVEAILLHPDLYRGPAMVKPPVVYLAGLLRAMQRFIDTDDWIYRCDQMGQRLYYPPNVAGWDDNHWLDTSTLLARWQTVGTALTGHTVASGTYDPTETAPAALLAALGFWGVPPLGGDSIGVLSQFSTSCLPVNMTSYQQRSYRALRQNALRHLIATAPDAQTC